jgi:hypothetical protein
MASSNQQQNLITVTVTTTSGNYDGDGRRFNLNEKLSTLLHYAAKDLGLVNTSDWAVRLGDRVLDPSRSLVENGVTSGAVIRWAPVERGGGVACIRS